MSASGASYKAGIHKSGREGGWAAVQELGLQLLYMFQGGSPGSPGNLNVNLVFHVTIKAQL